VTEHEHQVAFFKWMRLQYPNVIAYAIPNGGQRHPAVAAKLKREGVTPGIPDIHIADCNPGLYIEMKEPKKGRLSDVQKEMIGKLAMAGYPVAVCHGWEQAKDAVIQYLKGEK
jgi:hypothetical protein